MKWKCLQLDKLVITEKEETTKQTFTALVKLAKTMHTLESGISKHALKQYHDWAKIVITLLDCSIDWLEEGMNPQSLAEEAEKIFESTKSYKMQLTTLMLLCRFVKDDPISCERIAQKGLNLASECGLDKFKIEFDRILKSTLDNIHNLCHNKISFLISSPLLLKAVNPGVPVLSKDWRSLMLSLIENFEKEVAVHFSLLTKQTFIDLHRRFSGCKILVIDFYKISHLGVELETEGFDTELLTKEEIDQIPLVLGDDFGPNVDIAIILNKKGKECIELLKHFQIKHFVYFEFEDLEALASESPSPADFLLPFWIERVKETFVSLFLEESIRNISADMTTHLRLVQVESIDLVNHMVKDCKYYQCQVNHWKTDSIEAEKDLQFSTHNIVFTEEPGKAVSTQFKKGSLREVSPPFARLEAPQLLLSRDNEVLQIFDLLTKGKTKWVNLWGEYGAGKSLIVKLFEYEIKIRNMFPDGVYHFDLREMDCSKSIKKQMGKVLGIDFLVDTNEFFKNKKIFIILDGYEKVLLARLQTPTTLLDAMKENDINCLFVTEPDENGKLREVPDSAPFKVERLSDYQSLQYLLSLIAHNFLTFLTFRRDSLDKFAHSASIRDCKGLPINLKKYACRIFSNGLGINLEANQLYLKRSMLSSPGLENKFSMITEHENQSEIDDDLRSHPSLLYTEASSKEKKSLTISKTKPKSDNKKEGKQPKNRTKKKHKKEMH